jgi:hypothetical protein
MAQVLSGDVVVPKEPRTIEQMVHAIADIEAEARLTGHETLAYFLQMARIEAQIQADQKRETRPPVGRLPAR